MTRLIEETPPFWAIMDALPTALLCKDIAKASIYANSAALELLDLPMDQAVLSLSDVRQISLADPDSKEPLGLVHNPLLLALSGSALQQCVTLPTGLTVELKAQLIRFHFTSSSTVLIVLCPRQPQTTLPVSKWTADDDSELTEALAFDKLMSLISTELINVRPEQLDTHIQSALAALGEFCHADRSYVFLMNHDKATMSNTHEWVRAGISSHIERLQDLPQAAQPFIWQALAADAIFAVQDVGQLPAEAALEKREFQREDIQSILCSAMLSHGQLLGFVGCDMVARKRAWTASDIRRLKLVGHMIGNTIQNVRDRMSLQQVQQQLMQANKELQLLASRDGLTGIANRRQFDTVLQQELHRCARNKQPLGLILIDIDHFKAYNDNYGHQAGDDALKRVASLLRDHIQRQGELVARYGGEEFAIILPSIQIAQLKTTAENLLRAVQQLAIPHQHSVSDCLTISIGCSLMKPDKNSSPEFFIHQTDTALYRAKAQGRNQVCYATVTA